MSPSRTGTLASIQVGSPRLYTTPHPTKPMKAEWTTSFFRVPSPEPRRLFTTHLEGNEQADRKHHGHLDQAVLLYALGHYARWQAELGRSDIGAGGFGENFTLEGMDESMVCIGDVHAVGDAHIRVTAPRYPCWKIERRWNSPGLTAAAGRTGRTGWYCSVEREGMVEPGAPIWLLERPYPRWTVALVNEFAHGRNGDEETALELVECPLLDDWWTPLILRGARRARAS